MIKKIHVILILIIYISVSCVDCGVLISLKQKGPDNNPSPEESSDGGGGSSHDHITAPLEIESINFTREIISPKRKEGFFNESSEVIVVVAKITSLSENGIKN